DRRKGTRGGTGDRRRGAPVRRPGGAAGGARGADRERRPVIPLTLAEVAAAVGGALHDVPDPQARVTGDVELYSARIRPGGLFVALAGERVDGHAHAGDAVAAGAVGVLAARPVGV